MSNTHIPLSDNHVAILEAYGEHLANTGGNEPAELLLDMQPFKDGRPNHLMQTNIVRFVLAVGIESQVLLLARLIRSGIIPAPTNGNFEAVGS